MNTLKIENIEYYIRSEEEYNADWYGNHRCLTRLNGVYDNGEDFGLGDWTYQFNVDVTNTNGQEKSFIVAFQPEERNNGMKAYSGYDIDRASFYGYDADQSQELIDFCDGDESIINELYKIAHKAAKSEYNRLIELLKNEEITPSEDY